MNIRSAVKNVLLRCLREDPDQIKKLKKQALRKPDHVADGLNMGWAEDPGFVKAFYAGFNTGHKFGQWEDSVRWRAQISLWAATHASHLEGDFVECGVHTGILSVAICNYIGFASLPRKFWLFDTWEGIPEHQMSATELLARKNENGEYYWDSYELAKKNFAPFPNANLVRGCVPEVLTTVKIDKVAYLSIDMNIAAPELAAIEYFWDKLSSGAPVILDDYGWKMYSEQHEAMNKFARERGVQIATLPTGQGLLLKP